MERSKRKKKVECTYSKDRRNLENLTLNKKCKRGDEDWNVCTYLNENFVFNWNWNTRCVFLHINLCRVLVNYDLIHIKWVFISWLMVSKSWLYVYSGLIFMHITVIKVIQQNSLLSEVRGHASHLSCILLASFCLCSVVKSNVKNPV